MPYTDHLVIPRLILAFPFQRTENANFQSVYLFIYTVQNIQLVTLKTMHFHYAFKDKEILITEMTFHNYGVILLC